MPDRRAFVRQTIATVGAVALPPWATAPAGRRRILRADLILAGGVVYDGTGAAPAAADVAILGDRIEAIGPGLRAPGAAVVDMSGLALAPGFIDIHSHTDTELIIQPTADSKIRQGVTTEVAGQDGGSLGPMSDGEYEQNRDLYRSRYGIEAGYRDLAGFFAFLERHPASVNFASMVGAGQIRQVVVGADDRPATDGELSRMVQFVETALQQGACGLSTGLEYIPGAFAGLPELVAMSRPLRSRNLPYASHLRNEDDRLLAAIEEALNVGRQAGVPVQLSHLKAQGQRNWWKAETALALIDRAREDGLDVMFDRYPYVAYSTGLTSLFPVWSRDGGNTALLERLDQPETRERIRADVLGKIEQLGSWDAVQITSTAEEELAWARGRKLGELAAERDQPAFELLLELIRKDDARPGMIGYGMSEENTARFLSHPLGMVCSDGAALATEGPLATGSPHPRSFGTFPRVLGHYCRERRDMSFETAIHKMTAMPARRLHLAGRGVLTPGFYADLVAFDPATVADRATFERPHQYPAGIPHVMVNGQWVIQDGAVTPSRPGRPLTPAA